MKLFLNISIFLLFAGALSGQCLQMQGCPAGPVAYCDYSSNDNLLWHETYWISLPYASTDLPESAVDLCFSASDTCAGANLDIQYLLFLDTEGDGIRETVVSSANLPGFNTVYYNNAANPNYSGGTPRIFDERPVAAGQKYGFALAISGGPGSKTACVRWNTQGDPGTFVQPQLPYGNHLIQWIVSNGLGNADTCTYEFTVKDCKAPTVVCLNGLSANIMPTGLLTLWATDFIQYAEDNASAPNQLQLAMRVTGTGTGFPVDTAGVPLNSITFNCDDLGTQIVEIWVRDLEGNADYCETYVQIGDANGICGTGPVLVDARICVQSWCTGAPVSGVSLGQSAFSNYFQLQADGCFAADTNGVFTSLDFIPTKDDDPLNGVDLLDLVLIRKHILGLEPLGSPYAMIAADANNSRSITTFDIIEYSKLITGLYSTLPNNTSWRFVDGDYVFANPNNPFQTIFPETKTLASVQDTLSGDYTFKAVKIGDVDCSSIPGFAPEATDRAVSYLEIPDLNLAAGETVDVPVRFAESESWLGFQLGLAFDPAVLAVEAVLPGALPAAEDFTAGEPQAGRVNLLWFDALPHLLSPDAPAFILRLHALAPVRLQEVLSRASGPLRAEAYTGLRESRNLDFRFIPAAENRTSIGLPQPNPTNAGSKLTVYLETAAPIIVEIWDMQGRQLWHETRSGSTGMQQLEFPAPVFSGSGTYLWRVTTGGEARSGRLLVR